MRRVMAFVLVAAVVSVIPAPVGAAEDGVLVDLGTLGSTVSSASAVSDGGHVVGSSWTADMEEHAYPWTAGEGMVDLGTPGGPQHVFSWSAAAGLQDLGALPSKVTRVSAVSWQQTHRWLGNAQSNAHRPLLGVTVGVGTHGRASATRR